MALAKLQLTALPGIPMVQPGDDLCGIILDAVARAEITLKPQDVLVVAQKVVSKAEGRVIPLASVTPRPEARDWAEKTDKDPRLVDLILAESKSVVRHRPGVMIVEHRLGFIMANAGIDQSNVGPIEDGEHAILLPVDPDASAAGLRAAIQRRHDVDVGEQFPPCDTAHPGDNFDHPGELNGVVLATNWKQQIE